MDATSSTFVGRERELVFLKQRVDAALRGEGGLVFITGEGGIGKTRMAREVRPYAREHGFIWLEGRYLRDETSPFQSWVEAIRGFLRTAPPAMLEKVLPHHGPVLAKLVPEVGELLGPLPHLPAIGAEEERLRLFEALAGILTGVAREQPLVLFLDDLQWAPSVDVLRHLARGLGTERLLVVGTYREAELMENPALIQTLLAMNRERLFHSLPLKRLAEEEVASMVSQTLGQEASARLAGVVYQKTEGNPFFVEEVVRYLAESGAILPGEKGWKVVDITQVQLPYSVKAVVGERLERLGEEARSVLAWASVVGQEFTFPLLKEVTGMGEDRLLEVVDHAVAARMLVPSPLLRQEAYAFADEVVRDVLYQGIGPARRRRYHLKVGQAIEKVHARRLDEHYNALALHFLEGNDLPKAEAYALKAGDRASSVYSWERAIVHYQTAQELLEELEAEPHQQAEVLEKLALATALGRGKGALIYLEKALSIYETLGDRKKASAVHLRLGRPHGLVLDRGKAHPHNVKAVALLEPEGESPQLAQGYVQLGWDLAHGHGLNSEAVSLMEKGLSQAERLGDVVGVIEAARMLGHVLVYHTGEIERGLKLFQRGYEEVRNQGDLVRLSEVASELSQEYAYLRDAEEAHLCAEQAIQASRQAGTIRGQTLSALALAWACSLRGDATATLLNLDTAQQLARKAGVEVTQVGNPPFFVVNSRVHVFLGNWDKAETELLQLLEFANQIHLPTLRFLWVAPTLGWLYLESGNLDGAKAHLDEAVAFAHARGDLPPELFARALSAQVACHSGELEEGEAHLRRAQEILSNGSGWCGLAAEVYLAEGILASARQDWVQGEASFQRAVQVNRQYHLPYYEARTLLEWGQMYLLRHGAGDREQGIILLDQALVIFQRIQAGKMVERVLSLREQAEARPTRFLAFPDGLSQREVEVLRLIALGKSNSQIAEELLVSPNTVAHHVTNILNKTGTSNRTEAAAYATRHGLG